MKAEIYQWVQTLHPYFLHAGTQQSVSLTRLNCSGNYTKKLQGWSLLLVLDISWEGINMSVKHPQPKFTEEHMYM
jgi:hypothetical protein